MSASYQNNGFVIKVNYLPFAQSNEESSAADTLFSTPPSIDINNESYSITSSYNYKIQKSSLTSQLAINIANNKMDLTNNTSTQTNLYSSTSFSLL